MITKSSHFGLMTPSNGLDADRRTALAEAPHRGPETRLRGDLRFEINDSGGMTMPLNVANPATVALAGETRRSSHCLTQLVSRWHRGRHQDGALHQYLHKEWSLQDGPSLHAPQSASRRPRRPAVRRRTTTARPSSTDHGQHGRQASQTSTDCHPAIVKMPLRLCPFHPSGWQAFQLSALR